MNIDNFKERVEAGLIKAVKLTGSDEIVQVSEARFNPLTGQKLSDGVSNLTLERVRSDAESANKQYDTRIEAIKAEQAAMADNFSAAIALFEKALAE